jgi:DNA-binding NarL/FixJ family response regulator
MQRCLAAHASGYIVKDTSLAELATALKAVAAGTPYVDPRVAGAVLRRRALNHEAALDELSGRETEIVRLIAQGLSNRDIGTRLLLSEKTVKNHISRIFDKLHITARTQAAVYAIKTGIA